MNSLWNKNYSLFTSRFPALAEQTASAAAPYAAAALSAEKAAGSTQTGALAEYAAALTFPGNEPPWQITAARDGSLTATESGRALHSAYAPLREAERLAAGTVPASGAARSAPDEASEEPAAGVFCGFGLGYAPEAFAKAYPQAALILVEPDIRRLFAAFCTTDWSAVLNAPQCIAATGAPQETVITLIEQFGAAKCRIFSNPAQTAHAESYFSAVQTLIERNRRKDDINTRTLERFSHLWLRNSCRNLHALAEFDGVNCCKDAARTPGGSIPVCVLAAGPSLAAVLPYLTAVKERCIIVCVDTALRSCLAAGVEPDFIVLVDPQYWAYRHIGGLSSPSSVLITENAAYPAALRFPCRKKLLCSSLCPLAQYFEKRLGCKGTLGAGGSVSTTAWDFARLTGTATIYLAGLDLGFPGGQTHVRGSHYEEQAHSCAVRTLPAETEIVRTLYGASPAVKKDYNGAALLTDNRLSLYAWWFESTVAKYTPQVKTCTLTPQSLAIPGITPVSLQTLLSEPPRTAERRSFFANAGLDSDTAGQAARKARFLEVYGELTSGLEFLYKTAREGESLCNRALSHPEKTDSRIFDKLKQIDDAVSQSDCKEAAELVFPTERQLDELFRATDIPHNEVQASLTKSRIVYRELQRAISLYRRELVSAGFML